MPGVRQGCTLICADSARYWYRQARGASPLVVWRAIPRQGRLPADLDWIGKRVADECLNLWDEQPHDGAEWFLPLNELQFEREAGESFPGYRTVAERLDGLRREFRKRLPGVNLMFPAWVPTDDLERSSEWVARAQAWDGICLHVYGGAQEMHDRYWAYRALFGATMPLFVGEWNANYTGADERESLEMWANVAASDPQFLGATYYIWETHNSGEHDLSIWGNPARLALFRDPPTVQQGSIPMTLRDDIIREARARLGIPYGLPPGPGETDCSLYVRDVFEAAGLSFSPGVRVAEQERQDTVPIGWDDVLPGDLLFFEDTYDAGPPSVDGHIASHIGISLGAGTHRMLNALEPVSAETRIDTPYWQEHIFEARRHPALMAHEDTGGNPGSADPWAWWTAEQVADALGANLEHVRLYWPKLAEQLRLAGIYDRWTAIAVLGTIAVEVGDSFEPIHEYGTPVNWAGYSGGAAYAGRGFIQLTHDYNYRTYSEKLDELWGDGAPDLIANPDNALDPDVAAAVMAMYFRDHGIPAMAADGNWAGIRRAVNGGMTGWQTFADAVEALKAIPQTTTPAPPAPPAPPARQPVTRADLRAIYDQIGALLERMPA